MTTHPDAPWAGQGTPRNSEAREAHASAPSPKVNTQPDSAICAASACQCLTVATCPTCAAWGTVLDEVRERRAERMWEILDAAERRGYVLTGRHLWMPRRGRWRPFRIDDLDVLDRAVMGRRP